MLLSLLLLLHKTLWQHLILWKFLICNKRNKLYAICGPHKNEQKSVYQACHRVQRAPLSPLPHCTVVPLSARVRSDFVSSIRAHNCIIIYVFEGSLAEGCVEWGEVEMRLWSQTCINMFVPLELLLLGLSHGLFAVRYGTAGSEWGMVAVQVLQ